MKFVGSNLVDRLTNRELRGGLTPRTQLLVQRWLRKALGRARDSEVAIVAVAALIGLAVGTAVAVIGAGVAYLHEVLFGIPFSGHLSEDWLYASATVFIAPALGGTLMGLYGQLMRGLRPGEIVDPIEANALYGGRMSLIDSLNLAVLTIVSVGFGGSAGLEAAYTQTGSGFASKIGQALIVRRKDLRTLVGCGSAAAIAAAFDSPLAGAFYAFELVIGGYEVQNLVPVVAAALCGNFAIAAIWEPRQLFSPAQLLIEFPYNFYPAAMILGVGAALLSIATMRLVTAVEALLRLSHVPAWLKPALGGLGVGAIAMVDPLVLGSGHGAIVHPLQTSMAVSALMLLLGTKMLASALTVGSGMRGGLFSSSLLLGAAYGAAVAGTLDWLMPHAHLNHATFALIGMASVAAGIVGGPITMTLLVLETTNTFSLTVSAMVGVLTSAIIVRKAFGYSFATWRFHVRGLNIQGGYDVGWVSDLTVAKIMQRDFKEVLRTDLIAALREKLPLGGAKFAFVVDADRRYLGMVETASVHSPDYDATSQNVDAGELVFKPGTTLRAGQTVFSTLALFRKEAMEVLPVLDDHRRVAGYITEAYALRRYSQELQRHQSDHLKLKL